MMKKMLVPALIVAAVSAAALPAAAQSHNRPSQHQNDDRANYGGWQSINVRQASLDRRIDQGVRNGQLSRREATRVRNEFSALARLENQYRRGGLTAWERTDLDRRFDRLSASIRYERNDRDNRRN